ncbi:MAG: hypothetical protein ACPGYX_04570, partial [Oceanobacter sp.]
LQQTRQALSSGGRVLAYTGEDSEKLAIRCLQYLELYRLFSDQLSQMEIEIRKHLGYEGNSGIELGRMVFPTTRTLPWYERLVGHKLDKQGWRLTGSSRGLVMPGFN